MNKAPLLSIITPTYHQVDFIERTIRSIHEQKVDCEFEHIVIDGGSMDGTVELLKTYGDRITWISEPDQGQSDALNKGISMAKGEIIGWLNSDDLYLPGTMQKVVDYFGANPNCHWLYGNCKIINDQDQEFRKWITIYKNLLARKFYFPVLLLENFICQPSVFFRREAIEAVGPVALNRPLAMDYDLWLRMAKYSKPGVIRDYLACFRVHADAKSTVQSKQQFQEQFNIHQQHDLRKRYLFLHRLNISKTIFIYWLVAKLFSSKQKRQK